MAVNYALNNFIVAGMLYVVVLAGWPRSAVAGLSNAARLVLAVAGAVWALLSLAGAVLWPAHALEWAAGAVLVGGLTVGLLRPFARVGKGVA